jgi:single-stranded DNA-binding protein
MAKENYVFLVGQLLQESKIVKDKGGDSIRADCVVTTLRRDNKKNRENYTPVWDKPIVMSGNKEMINKMEKIDQFDFVEVKGTVTTKEIKRGTICPHCKGKNVQKGVMTFITPTFIGKRRTAQSRTEGFPYLREHSEISNTCKIIGRLCRDPELYTNSEGVVCCEYQIAVNRKYYIEGSGVLDRTDYPWVKTFNEQAQEDINSLKMGSLVYLDGCIRTRTIDRITLCEHCNQDYNWRDVVLEILPYSVEYLADCDKPEPKIRDLRSDNS